MKVDLTHQSDSGSSDIVLVIQAWASSLYVLWETLREKGMGLTDGALRSGRSASKAART